jgi:inosine-uridine nucleoside N-ribohydrolase
MMMTMTRRLVLDCDTGTDDAIAIMLACSRPELELLAVTAVWGNHAVEYTADNSLRTLDIVGRSDVPVLAGCDGPIAPRADLPPAKRSPEPDLLPLPPSRRAPEPRHAVEWLVETARAATEQFTLVPTGSLSNIAAAIRADASIVDAIDEIVVMGGVIQRGGPLPAVETNIGHDPEAADVVLGAGFERLVLIPLDATHRAIVTSEQCATLRREGGVAAKVAADFIEQRIERYRTLPAMAGRAAAPVHDALTVAYLVDPTLVTLRPARVRVETAAAATRGRTDIELDPSGPGQVLVAVDADPLRFFALLHSSLSMPA